MWINYEKKRELTAEEEDTYVDQLREEERTNSR